LVFAGSRIKVIAGTAANKYFLVYEIKKLCITHKFLFCSTMTLIQYADPDTKTKGCLSILIQYADFAILFLSATSSAAALVVLLLMVATALYLSLKTRYNEEIHLKVEMFLKTYDSSKPTSYTFSEVKKIARRFKKKVGVGAP